MDTEEKSAKAVPPYVAYKTLKNFLRTLSHALPSRIDKSVMRSQSGSGQTQLLHALKFLRLIDSSGTPSAKLPLLVKSEGAEYQKVLREILMVTYPFLNTPGFDLKSATMHQLEEQFSTMASGDTVRKCIAFFIPAAKEAGIELSPYIEKPGKRASSNAKVKRRLDPKAVSGAQEESAPHAPVPPMSWHEMLLSKFPSFDPNWPDDVKTKWFESFADLMARGGGK